MQFPTSRLPHTAHTAIHSNHSELQPAPQTPFSATPSIRTMAGTKTDNAFEVLSREEAAPEVEHPESAVTHEDVKMGLAASGTLDKDVRGTAGAGNAKKASRGRGSAV